MAIEVQNPAALKIKYDGGIDQLTGKAITKTKTYSNVAVAANNDSIFEVANAIASLQKHSTLEISRIDNTTLAQ